MDEYTDEELQHFDDNDICPECGLDRDQDGNCGCNEFGEDHE